MGVERMLNPEFLELTARFPLEPIEDEDSYQDAIEILDDLFALDDLRTRAQMAYFGALAKLAFEYEMSHNLVGSAT